MKSSFPPIVDKNTRILILGSLPGEESLRQQKYYAHPRNNFWRLIFNVFDQPIPATYEEKIAFLKSKSIGLWDVISNAGRTGSLDSKIRNPIPNDFGTLLKDYPDIKVLVFNGHKAQRTFNRLVEGTQVLPDNLKLEYCPSTSPAYTGKSFQIKMAEWKKIKELTG
jgi:TDG/mug DNA glycosylase family protein